MLNGLTLEPAVRTVRSALPLLRQAEWAADRQRLCHVHQAPVAVTGGVHHGQERPHQPQQEPLMSLAPEGILVNTVSPGTYVSESFKAALRPLPDVDEEDLYDVMRCTSSWLRASGVPQSSRRPEGDRTRHRLRGFGTEHLYDRGQHQCRWRLRLHVGVGSPPTEPPAAVRRRCRDRRSALSISRSLSFEMKRWTDRSNKSRVRGDCARGRSHGSTHGSSVGPVGFNLVHPVEIGTTAAWRWRRTSTTPGGWPR